MEGEYVGALNLRGLTIPVFRGGGRFFAILAGKSVFVCGASESWESALKALVEEKLGEISRISPDAWIGFFDNGGREDVGLFLRGRLLKVWLCERRPTESELREIERESKNIVDRLSFGKALNYSEPEIRGISDESEGEFE